MNGPASLLRISEKCRRGDAPPRTGPVPARRLATSCIVMRKTWSRSVVVDHQLMVEREPVHLPTVDHRGAVRVGEGRDRTRLPLLHRPVQGHVVRRPRHPRGRLLGVAHEVEDDDRLAGDGVGRLAGRAVDAVHLDVELVGGRPTCSGQPAHLVCIAIAPRRELGQDHRVAHRAPERREVPDRRGAFELGGVDVRRRERAAAHLDPTLVERLVGRGAGVERARTA